MFPWSTSRKLGKTIERGEGAVVRSAEEMGAELNELRALAKAETDFDGLALSTEDRMSKTHIARSLFESATPAGVFELRRVWRDIDAMIGPGQSVLHALSARYPKLARAFDRMARHFRQSVRATSESARKVALSRMKGEISRFAHLQEEIIAAVKTDSAALKEGLSARLADREFAELLQTTSGKTAPSTLLKPTVRELTAESEAALKVMERSFRDLHKAALVGQDARAASRAWEVAAREDVRALRAGKVVPRDEELISRIQRLAEWGDPVDLGISYAKKLRRDLRRELPILEELKYTDRMFQEALGIVAQARGEKPKLLRQFVEHGPSSLTAKQLEKIEGYLGQLRGLLPEAAAVQMKFMEGVFYKRAFEALANFPPALRSQMSVEMVEGPLWVVGGKGPPRQFGDGCLLLTGPKGQSAIVGLGEFKAGFDDDLLEQLFVRSDGRSVSSQIKFRAPDGQIHFRVLTRDFTFGGGHTHALRDPPLYVYGRTGGASADTEELFKRMVDEQMQSGREMYKVQLPFSAEANARFAEQALSEAVKMLRRIDKGWGH